nr:uncharacterized mitochondrial protein AtMg00810-like [Tanacetum cinerariifolium]
MASEQSSSGPALHDMTPRVIRLGLVHTNSSSTSYVPPSRNDWDLLFQPMFDELLNPPPSGVNQVPEDIAPIVEVIPPVNANLTGSPSSIMFEQDAPSTSNSTTPTETQSSVIPQDAGDDNLDIEVAHMGKPKTYKEALTQSSWIEAMQEELHEFKRLKVWELVPRPDKVMVITLKRIYKDYRFLKIPEASLSINLNMLLNHLRNMVLNLANQWILQWWRNLNWMRIKRGNPSHYHGMIGTLLYLTASRPDLQFAICICARYQARPTEKHVHVVKRIFRYLRGTVHRGLWYLKDSSVSLAAFADADHAGCQDTRRSTSGSVQFLTMATTLDQQDDVLSTTIKVVSRHQTTQQYGVILPIELTNDDIRNNKAYKEYYACATGEAAPKPKASTKKKTSGSASSTTPPTPIATPTPTTTGKQPARATIPTEPTDVEGTEAEQLKIVLKQSRQETHISQQRGSDVDEQTKGKEECEGDKTDESDDDDDEEETTKIGEQEVAKSDEGDDEATESDKEREYASASTPSEPATESAGRTTTGLGVETLTPELLAGPTYELIRGSCNSLEELEYHLEEVYKATTDQLDWVNPEGQQYPHILLQPLPLIPDNQGRSVIPFEHFINNDLEYL